MAERGEAVVGTAGACDLVWMRREYSRYRRCDEGGVDDLKTRDGGGRERCGVKKAVSRSVGVPSRRFSAFTYSEASQSPTTRLRLG